MMEELRRKFEEVTEREPTDAEIRQLYRLKEVLRLGDNDALWLVLIGMGYHLTLYEEIPSRIAETTKAVLRDLEQTARAKLAAETKQAQRTLTEQVAASARAAAGNMTRRAMWRAVGMTAVVMAVILATAAWYVHTTLKSVWYDAGLKQGQVDTYKVIDYAAVKWAFSDEGRLARAFAQDGTLDWATSAQGKVARALSEKGLLKKVWAGIDVAALDDVAVVNRRDAEWLDSDSGRRARVRSKDGTLEWVDSSEGKLARNLIATAPLNAIADGAELAVVYQAEATWLASDAGQRARARTKDGTLEWADSAEGKLARQLIATAPPNAIDDGAELAVVYQAEATWLASDAGRRARTFSGHRAFEWAAWLQALVDNGLLFDGEPTDQVRCRGIRVKGYAWKEAVDEYPRFCEVWQGRVYLQFPW